MVLTSPALCGPYEIYKTIVSDFQQPVKPCGAEKVRPGKPHAARESYSEFETAV